MQRNVRVERHVEHARPLLVGHVDEVRGAAEAGVVDQHVDPAGRRDRRSSNMRWTCASTVTSQSTVGGRCPRIWASCSAASSEAALVLVADHDERAFLGAALGGGEADAGAGGGGDEHRLAGEQRVAGRAGRCGCSSLGASGARLARQAERPLADDVALDLVGAGVDGVGARPEEQPLQLAESYVRPLRAGSRAGAEHVHRELAELRGATSPSRAC